MENRKMRKIITLLAALSFSLNSFATDLNFSNIKLTQLANLAFKEIAKQDFTADDHFMNDSQIVSIYLSNRSNKTIIEEVQKLIDVSGYDVKQTNNIYHITKKQKEAEKKRVSCSRKLSCLFT